MSVVLMGMGMPGTCIDCDLYDEHYRYGMCKGHGVLFGPEDDWKYETKPNWCPLRPLPEKHGRLIEDSHLKDTLDYYIREAGWDAKTNRVLGWVKDDFIDSEPTIVESEGKVPIKITGKIYFVDGDVYIDLDEEGKL